MILFSIDSNDANSAPLHKKQLSSLSGAVGEYDEKLEDVGALVARILMPILFITAGWGKLPATRVPNNIWSYGRPRLHAATGDSA